MRLGDWTLDNGQQRLLRDGENRVLEPKSHSVLMHLIERAPAVVSLDDLLRRTWPNAVVTYDVVYQTIANLRRALGDSAKHPKYVETIPKRGYRLLLPVELVQADPGSSAPDDAAGGPTGIVLDRFSGAERNQRVRRCADEVCDVLRSRLVGYPELRVMGGHARNDDASDYVIEGFTRRRSSSVTIGIVLRRTSDDEALWSREFELANTPADGSVDQLARTIGRSLRLWVKHDVECEQVRRQCRSAEAAHLYRLASAEQYQISQGGAFDPELLLLNVRRAAELDPEVPQIHRALANAYLWAWTYRRLPYEGTRDLAHAAMARALEIAPQDSDSLVALASLQTHFDLDYAAAEDSLRGAIALNPNVWFAHNGIGEVARRQGRSIAAIEHYGRALRMVDGDGRLYAEYAKCLDSVDRYSDAIRAARAGIDLVDAGYYRVALTEELAFAQVRTGDIEGAAESVEATLAGIDPRLQPYLSAALAEVGQEDRARAMLAQLEARRTAGPSALVHAYLALGELDLALDTTMRAVAERDALVLCDIRCHPRYQPLREHPGWRGVIGRLEAMERGS